MSKLRLKVEAAVKSWELSEKRATFLDAPLHTQSRQRLVDAIMDVVATQPKKNGKDTP